MTRVDPYERPDEWHVGQSEVSKKQRTWLMLTSIETYTFTRLFLLQLTSQTLFSAPAKTVKETGL